MPPGDRTQGGGVESLPGAKGRKSPKSTSNAQGGKSPNPKSTSDANGKESHKPNAPEVESIAIKSFSNALGKKNGGSSNNSIQSKEIVSYLKNRIHQPILLFPGSPNQFSKDADALLYLMIE